MGFKTLIELIHNIILQYNNSHVETFGMNGKHQIHSRFDGLVDSRKFLAIIIIIINRSKKDFCSQFERYDCFCHRAAAVTRSQLIIMCRSIYFQGVRV